MTDLVRTNKAVEAMKQHAATAAEMREVQDAKRAAALLPAGAVVSDPSAAMMLTDLLDTVQGGIKVLRARKRELVAIPDAMKKAVSDVVDPLLEKLEVAVKNGKAAQAAWLIAEQRRINEEERRKQAEAAAAKLNPEPDEDGDVPPPDEVQAPPPYVPPAKAAVETGATKSYLVRRLKVRLVNHHECDPTWLGITDAPAAIDAFKRAVRLEEAVEPADDKPVVWKGVEYYYDIGVASRATR